MRSHKPVLLNEVIENLNIKADGIYVDATFGRGGHSRAILQRLNSDGRLLVIDKDLEAIKSAESLQDTRVSIKHSSYILLYEWIEQLGLVGKISGILLDLGVSSPQLDDENRGFSFMREGPLDMRMDISQKLSAEFVVNNYKEKDLENIFKKYGEERFSKRIAHAIVNEREVMPITTTLQLAKIISAAHPKWERGKNPATRVFQALRIYVNSELEELENCLEQCLEVLTVSGRLLVISFHSLEDRCVKEFCYKYAKGGNIPIGLPLRHDELNIKLKCLGKGLRASENEIENNPRARSAILRIMEKIQ